MQLGKGGCLAIVLGFGVIAVLMNVLGFNNDSSPQPDTAKQEQQDEEATVDFSRPIYGKGNLRGTLYGCIDWADLGRMTASDMELMDQGGSALTCHPLSDGVRLRVLARHKIYADVLPYDVPPQYGAGQDLWVFDDDLRN